ncbi:MAG: hypothetical protein P8Y70_00385 [Candidatus Lokiarchaeota archaeon]
MDNLNKIDFSSDEQLKEAQESFYIAQEVLRRINRVVTEIKDDLKGEKEGNANDLNKIKLGIRKKRYDLNQIQRKIKKLKNRAKSHKKAIDQWKQWYKAIRKGDKSEERKKLSNEINRRAAEIKRIEEKIGNSFPTKAKIREEIDNLEIKLLVFEQTKFEGPVNQDPRLLDLLKQQQEAEKFLESARIKLENIKNQAEVGG